MKFVSMLFLILEKGMSKKTVLGIFRFVSMLFLIFEKAMSKKNCARYFTICMYAFFKNNWKEDEQKNCARYFQIRKYAFFLIWLFFSMNGGHRDIWGLYVCFLWVLLLLKNYYYKKGLYKYFKIYKYPFLTWF